MNVNQQDIIEVNYQFSNGTTKPLSKQSSVICQLIGGYTERGVVKIGSRVRNSILVEIIDKIVHSIF